jgi:hypothetical protein
VVVFVVLLDLATRVLAVVHAVIEAIVAVVLAVVEAIVSISRAVVGAAILPVLPPALRGAAISLAGARP